MVLLPSAQTHRTRLPSDHGVSLDPTVVAGGADEIGYLVRSCECKCVTIILLRLPYTPVIHCCWSGHWEITIMIDLRDGLLNTLSILKSSVRSMNRGEEANRTSLRRQ